MDAPKYNRGGWIPTGPTMSPVRLEEGERIIDSKGRVRAMVVNGRLLQYPLWLVPRLPRGFSR